MESVRAGTWGEERGKFESRGTSRGKWIIIIKKAGSEIPRRWTGRPEVEPPA